MRATKANAKKLGADRHGFGSFKHRLMRELGISESLYTSWVVPTEWLEAFLRANGRGVKKY